MSRRSGPFLADLALAARRAAKPAVPTISEVASEWRGD